MRLLFTTLLSLSSSQPTLKAPINRCHLLSLHHSSVYKTKFSHHVVKLQPSDDATSKPNNILDYLPRIYSAFEEIDRQCNGWVLSYANTKPYGVHEPVGITFLLTNVAYIYAGIHIILFQCPSKMLYILTKFM